MTKRDRQDAILELVAAHAIGSQEALRRHLARRGWHVTQATLSRDLRELGVARVPTEDGARYVLPERLGGEDAAPALEAVLPQFLGEVDGVAELLVVRTLPSGAQPVAEALDAAGWPEVIGTIAGENTILVICRSARAREAVARRLRELRRASSG